MQFWVNKDIQNSWIFQDAEKFKWWVDLFLMADEEGKILMSLSDLTHRWKQPKTTVHRFLENLRTKPICGTRIERLTEHLTVCGIESCKDVRNAYTERTQENPLISLSPTPPISFNPQELSKTTTAPAYVRTQEDEFIQRYKSEGLWMDVALILHVKSLEKCKSLFDEFVVEYQHNCVGHKDYNDFKRHFIQWARVALKKENDNGNDSRQNQRRGVQVVANSPEDYEGPF